MNRPIATNTTPQIQNVISTVVSMLPQLDAISVNHQGLTNVKTTDPTTMIKRKIATAISLESL